MAGAAQRVFVVVPTLSALRSDGTNELGARQQCCPSFRRSRASFPSSRISAASLHRPPVQVPYANFHKFTEQIVSNYSSSFAFPPNLPAVSTSLHTYPVTRFLIGSLIIFIINGIFCGYAQASEAIKASSFGLKVASFLQQTGWPDQAIVFLMATLPVLELRGAIPVGYWMQMDPIKLSILSVLGNMLPVPFIVLYLEKLARALSNRSSTTRKIVDNFFESTQKKGAQIQEYGWIGLMAFVAIPLPGTGAWTGAIIASLLGMPFWDAITANFCGVVIACLVVNLLVNLGLASAIIVGVGLGLLSTFTWKILRAFGMGKQ